MVKGDLVGLWFFLAWSGLEVDGKNWGATAGGDLLLMLLYALISPKNTDEGTVMGDLLY